MSLPIPLSVVLSSGRTYRPITREVRDLTFRWTDPGGFASCQVSLDRPLSIQPDEVAYYGYMAVYDARSGATVWDGRLEDPGRSAGADGQVWDLTGVGGQAHTSDRIIALVYVDRRLNEWRRADDATKGGTNSIAEPGDAGTAPGIKLQWPQGVGLVTNSRVNVYYPHFIDTGQKVARVSCSHVEGESTTTDNDVQLTGHGGPAPAANLVTHDWSTTPQTITGSWGSTWVTSGHTMPQLRIIRTAGATTVNNDRAWSEFSDVVVVGSRLDRDGVELTSGYTTSTVLASDVVEDMLGRLLPEYDPDESVVATTSYAIEQLAYTDGADAAKILDDLMAFESGYTWRVWERTAANLWRLEWTAVPTSVRYEATALDGYDSQGSADGLYNAVTVRWRDAAGRVRTTTRTSTSPDLTAAGLTRQGQIDLGDEVGSEDAAERAGDNWLADRVYPPNAGRLRVARRILDLQTGRMVDPWEIRPGLIRVRGILPRIDALNSSTRDGVTTFRIVSAEYRASDAAAVLELDSYAPSTARTLADLQRRPAIKRRR